MKIRDAFIADDGYTLVEIDLKQAEAMVVAWLANDEKIKEAFKRGDDIHCLNASLIFKKPYDWIVKHKKDLAKEMRQSAKVVTHGWAYGAGWVTIYNELLESGVKTTPKDCKEMIRQLEIERPAIKRWHKEIEKTLKTTKTLETPLGFRRTFYGRFSSKQLRDALAFIPQSTVGHLIVKVWTKIYEKYPEVYPCANVHDSLLIQVPDDKLGELIPKLCKEFEIPLTINNDVLIIPTEVKIGKRWGSMEDYDEAIAR